METAACLLITNGCAGCLGGVGVVRLLRLNRAKPCNPRRNQQGLSPHLVWEAYHRGHDRAIEHGR